MKLFVSNYYKLSNINGFSYAEPQYKHEEGEDMKALIYMGPKNVVVQDHNIPDNKDCALIKVSYAGICGSDIGIVLGKHPRAKAPLVLGHEFVGVVESIKENKRGIKKGDKVVVYPLIVCGKCRACRTGSEHVCNFLRLIGIDVDGGMAEYASVPIEKLYKVPEGLEDDVATLIEPLAVIVHGINEIGVNFGDNVVVTGAGPIGLLSGLALRDAGASDIYFTEIDDFRLSMCRKFGFNAIDIKNSDVISIIRQNTDNEGADILIEASGAPGAALQMTEMVRPKGRILMLSIHKQPNLVDLRQINFKEITIAGSRVYTRQEFEYATKYAVKIKEDLAKLITHRVPLKNGDEAFKIVDDKNVNKLKILIDCKNV